MLFRLIVLVYAEIGCLVVMCGMYFCPTHLQQRFKKANHPRLEQLNNSKIVIGFGKNNAHVTRKDRIFASQLANIQNV